MKRFLFAFVCAVLTFSANAYTVTYSCGTATGTAPTDSTNYDSNDSVTVKPNSCDVPSGQHFAGYVCGSTNVAAGNKFTISGNTTCTAQWKNGKFAVTTTEIAVDGIFNFSLSAVGTFTVDCGNGGVLSGTNVNGNTITRTNNTSAIYTCTYSGATVAESKTISFDGTVSGLPYSTSETNAAISFFAGADDTESAENAEKIAIISGSFSNLFPGVSNNYPLFYATFKKAINLTSIPSTLFGGYTKTVNCMFSATFQDCTSLESIPSNLFSSFTTGRYKLFAYTFSGCTSLKSIPSDLFASFTTGAERMFVNTFSATGITSIPSDLFKKFTVGFSTMFSATFMNCSGLTSIPSGLFASFTTGASNMFANTFRGCSNLTTIPGDLWSNITQGYLSLFELTFSYCSSLETIPSNLFANITTGAEKLFNSTFLYCTSLTSIPVGLFKNFTTGFKSMFNCTFYHCESLTSLPPDLFANITSGAEGMFRLTFYYATSLTGYIPPSLFAGLIENNATYETNMMEQIFHGTKLKKSCPSGTTLYNTPYDSYWETYVSCTVDAGRTCLSGEYLPKYWDDCKLCPNGYTCSGGTYTFSKTSDQGIVVNTITIVWNGASQSDIDANNAGTTVYGGDIRTPRAATPIPGKIFRGWKFTFDLTSLLNQTSTNASKYGFRNNPSASCGFRTNNILLYYTQDQIKDQTWGATFSYGKVRGDALCSSTNNTNYTTGTPDESTGTGQYCWCKVTHYQPNGSNNWLKTSSSLWTRLADHSSEDACACNCAGYCGIKVYSDSNFRTAIYNVSQ